MYDNYVTVDPRLYAPFEYDGLSTNSDSRVGSATVSGLCVCCRTWVGLCGRVDTTVCVYATECGCECMCLCIDL